MASRNNDLARALAATAGSNSINPGRGSVNESPKPSSLRDMIANASRKRDAKPEAAKRAQQPKQQPRRQQQRQPAENRPLQHLPDHEILALLHEVVGGGQMTVPGLAAPTQQTPLGLNTQDSLLKKLLQPAAAPLPPPSVPASAVDANEILQNFLAGKAAPKTLQELPRQKMTRNEPTTARPKAAAPQKKIQKKTDDDSGQVQLLKDIVIRQQNEIEKLRSQLKKCTTSLKHLQQKLLPQQREQLPKQYVVEPKEKPKVQQRTLMVVEEEEDNIRKELSLAEQLRMRLAREKTVEEKTIEEKVRYRNSEEGRKREEALRWAKQLKGDHGESVQPSSVRQVRRPSSHPEPTRRTVTVDSLVKQLQSSAKAAPQIKKEEPGMEVVVCDGNPVIEVLDSDCETSSGETDAEDGSRTGEQPVTAKESHKVTPVKEEPTVASKPLEALVVEEPTEAPTDVMKKEVSAEAPVDVPMENPSVSFSEGSKRPLKEAFDDKPEEESKEECSDGEYSSRPIKKRRRLSLEEWKRQRKEAAEAFKSNHSPPSSPSREAALSHKTSDTEVEDKATELSTHWMVQV